MAVRTKFIVFKRTLTSVCHFSLPTINLSPSISLFPPLSLNEKRLTASTLSFPLHLCCLSFSPRLSLFTSVCIYRKKALTAAGDPLCLMVKNKMVNNYTVSKIRFTLLKFKYSCHRDFRTVNYYRPPPLHNHKIILIRYLFC
uniref:Uncharacterized protein n=1 Tax=Octopus bimaculoides TaxID=37653 RepID=A0A0L8G845_OCTBM